MKKIFIGTKNYSFPSTWNELTKEQLLFISNLFLQKLIKQEMVVFLTIYFSGLRFEEIKRMNPLIFEQLEHQYNWIWKKLSLTKQLLPIIRRKFKKYYGPEEGFANMSYEQFIIFSETYYQAYIVNKDDDNLNKLIGSLYTSKKNTFDSDEVNIIADKLSKISPEEKMAIVFFYEGNRTLIGTRFEKLMSSGKSKTSTNHNYDFLQVIELINNGDVSKNNEIKRTNIYEIFTHLTNITNKNERSNS